jgi:hypothetical protein
LRYNYISIRQDVRAFENSADMFGHCRKCGRPMVVLPEDKRYGFCFDCLDFLQISRKSEVGEGRTFFLPHEHSIQLH